GTALQRLDEIHRHLGLVMAIRLEVLRPDAELVARHIDDQPLGGGLRDLDVGFRIEVLRGGGRLLGCGRLSRGHESLVPRLSFVLVANSPAAHLGPSAGVTRRTLRRPSAHTTVKPSVETSTTSPILPPMPFGSRAGKGF